MRALNARKRMRVLLVAFFGGGVAYACVQVETKTNSAPDADMVDAQNLDETATPPTDAADAAANGDAAIAATCGPEAVPALPPNWGLLARRSACDAAALEPIVKCLFGDPSTSLSECQSYASDPDWSRCVGCLIKGDTDGAVQAPIVVHQGVSRLNVAGCLAFAVADSGLSGCVAEWHGSDQCRAAACESCADAGPNGYEHCRTLARAVCEDGGKGITPECAVFAAEAGCAPGNDFFATARDIAVRFCASPDAAN